MSTQPSINETYGEILTPSLDLLINQVTFKASDVFVDLGSGRGQIVLHFFLQTPIKKAYGIEINPSLHQQAQAALQQAKRNHSQAFTTDRSLHFIEGSFLTHPFDDASIVLINATCFTQSLLQSLTKKVDNTPSIHTVLSIRPLTRLNRLRFRYTQKVQCSWDSALCYIYTL